MSHKEKLCAPALTSHIETCHQTFCYAPLIVNHARPIPSANPGGMRAIAEEKIEGAVAERMSVALKQQEELRKAFLERFEKGFGGAKHVLNEKKRQSLMEAFEAEAQNELAELEQKARKEFSEKFSAETSVEAIEDKATRAFEALVKEYGEAAKFPDIPYVQHRKHDQLGLFFSETDCWRSEGLVHQPCGDTFAILPGESLEETNTLITTETNANSATSNIDNVAIEDLARVKKFRKAYREIRHNFNTSRYYINFDTMSDEEKRTNIKVLLPHINSKKLDDLIGEELHRLFKKCVAKEVYTMERDLLRTDNHS